MNKWKWRGVVFRWLPTINQISTSHWSVLQVQSDKMKRCQFGSTMLWIPWRSWFSRVLSGVSSKLTHFLLLWDCVSLWRRRRSLRNLSTCLFVISVCTGVLWFRSNAGICGKGNNYLVRPIR